MYLRGSTELGRRLTKTMSHLHSHLPRPRPPSPPPPRSTLMAVPNMARPFPLPYPHPHPQYLPYPLELHPHIEPLPHTDHRPLPPPLIRVTCPQMTWPEGMTPPRSTLMDGVTLGITGTCPGIPRCLSSGSVRCGTLTTSQLILASRLPHRRCDLPVLCLPSRVAFLMEDRRPLSRPGLRTGVTTTSQP